MPALRTLLRRGRFALAALVPLVVLAALFAPAVGEATTGDPSTLVVSGGSLGVALPGAVAVLAAAAVLDGAVLARHRLRDRDPLDPAGRAGRAARAVVALLAVAFLASVGWLARNAAAHDGGPLPPGAAVVVLAPALLAGVALPVAVLLEGTARLVARALRGSTGGSAPE